MGHNHDHDHHHEHSELGEMDLRVRALETVLAGKGYIDPAALDVLIDTYQTKIGPRNGGSISVLFPIVANGRLYPYIVDAGDPCRVVPAHLILV